MLLLFCPDLNLFRHIRVLVQEYRTKEKSAPTVLTLPTDDDRGAKRVKIKWGEYIPVYMYMQ